MIPRQLRRDSQDANHHSNVWTDGRLDQDLGGDSVTSEEEWLHFPQVDVQQILVPWSDCLSVVLGPVQPDLVDEMKRRDFDYAPVFHSSDPRVGVLGLVSRRRLGELVSQGGQLTKDTPGVYHYQWYDGVSARSDLDGLLRQMAERPVWIVEDEGDAGEEYGEIHVEYGIVTRSDLNKHPIRVIVYEVLAKLEMALADLVREHLTNHLDWIRRLSEESQARILGYWELSKLQGVDLGPVVGATLADLLNVLARNENLRGRLGYDSRNAFEDSVGGIAGVRNQTMHPVRPLVGSAESCTRLADILKEAIRLTQRARSLREEARSS